ELVIASRDFERSLTAITSPVRRLYEGILTTSPLTVMCLCPTNWRAAERVGAIPKRYTVLSNRASNNFNSSSPVTPSLEEALVNKLANWRSNTPYVYFAFCFSNNWIAYSDCLPRRLALPCCPGG